MNGTGGSAARPLKTKPEARKAESGAGYWVASLSPPVRMSGERCKFSSGAPAAESFLRRQMASSRT